MANRVCPKCGSECDREEVDIEVGVQYGSWYCLNCDWDEETELDRLLPKVPRCSCGSLPREPHKPDCYLA